MSVPLQILILVVCQQQQVLTPCPPIGKKQAVDFPLTGFLGRNIIGHLDALKHSVSVAHDKVALSRTFSQVIDIQSLILALAHKMPHDDGLKTPAKIVAGK